MATTAPQMTTTVSTKGQVILPKAARDHGRWPAGTKLIVEETEDGLLLKPAVPARPQARIEDVYGSLHYDGPPISLEDMDAAITAEVVRRAACGRY